MNRRFLTLFLILAPIFSTYAQECPRHLVDCRGACGWFIDANHDGYCDFTAFSDALFNKIRRTNDSLNQLQKEKETRKTDSIRTAEALVKKNDLKGTTGITGTTKGEQCNKCPYEDSQKCREENLPAPVAQKKDTTAANQAPSQANTYKVKKYDFMLIFGLCLFFYLVSLILVSKKTYRKSTHRQIWNTLLLLSFLNTGLTGLFLVIQLNYHIFFTWFSGFLFWHVEFGISMAAISILHILWHWKYFRNLLIKQREEKTGH